MLDDSINIMLSLYPHLLMPSLVPTARCHSQDRSNIGVSHQVVMLSVLLSVFNCGANCEEQQFLRGQVAYCCVGSPALPVCYVMATTRRSRYSCKHSLGEPTFHAAAIPK